MLCRNHVDVSEGVQPCTRCGAEFCAHCLVTIHGLPYCGNCKGEKVLDVQSGSDTRELPLANIGRRLAALWIDRMMFGATALAIIFIGASRGGNDSEFLIIVVLAAFGAFIFGMIVYEALMMSRNGQTLGKMMLKIKVVRPDGTPISAGQAWGRALLRGALVHVLTLLNYIPALATKEKTCIHDLVANTRVVKID